MILWTIQNLLVLERLRTTGFISAKLPESEDRYSSVADKWMTKRLNLSTPFCCDYPIWGWFRYSESTSRPDLRCKWLLPRGTRGCLLKIDIPDSEVLLSQFEMWTWVMRGQLLPLNCDDKQCSCNNISKTPHDINSRKVSDSWEAIFDLNAGCEMFWGLRDSRAIQACFPVLRIEHVKDIRLFTAR